MDKGLRNKPRLVDRLPHPVIFGGALAVVVVLLYNIIRRVACQ